MKKVLCFCIALLSFLGTAWGEDHWLWLTSESPIYGKRIIDGAVGKEDTYMLFIHMDDKEENLRLVPVLKEFQEKYKMLHIVVSYTKDDPAKIIAVVREYNAKLPIYSKLAPPCFPEPKWEINAIVTDSQCTPIGQAQKAWDALTCVKEIFEPKDAAKPAETGEENLEGTLAQRKFYGIKNPLAGAVVKEHEDLVKMFEPDRAWKSGYKRLSALVKRDEEDTEAKAMLDKVNRYLSSKGELESNMKEEPAATLYGLQQLARAAKGIQPHDKNIQEAKAALEEDRSTKLLAIVIGKICKFEKNYEATFGAETIANAFIRPESEDKEAEEAEKAKDAESDDQDAEKSSAKTGKSKEKGSASKAASKSKAGKKDTTDEADSADGADDDGGADSADGEDQDAGNSKKDGGKSKAENKADSKADSKAGAGKKADGEAASETGKGKKSSAEDLLEDAEKILLDLGRILQSPGLEKPLVNEALTAARTMNTYVKLLGGQPVILAAEGNQMTDAEKAKFEQARSAFSGKSETPDRKTRKNKKATKATKSTKSSHSKKRSSRDR